MKYIVCRYKNDPGENDLFRIWLFSQNEIHKDFYQRSIGGKWIAVSAGFVMLESGKLICYGSSESLGLKCDNKRDTDLLNSQLDQDYKG